MTPPPAEKPDLCNECMKAGVIATKHGPTCTHTNFKWPDNWAAMTETQRVDWLWVNRTKLS